jgi:hypothetical protein
MNVLVSALLLPDSKSESRNSKREERFLSAQADAFPTGSESSIAGANAEEKIGLLRSIPQNHPGCTKRK